MVIQVMAPGYVDPSIGELAVSSSGKRGRCCLHCRNCQGCPSAFRCRPAAAPHNQLRDLRVW